MKRRSFEKAYENIRPDEEARARMLRNILNSSEIPPAGKDDTMKHKKMRPLVIAAIISLMIILMGCAVVAMNLQDLKIGEYTYKQGEILDSEGNILKETYVTNDVISLQGIQNTPVYFANQEWFLFTESYTPELGEYWESDEAYWAYDVVNQTMVDKIDEICNKYNLKVIGKPWHEHVDCYQFLPLVGIDDLLLSDSQAKLHIPRGRFFEGGSFTVYGTLTLVNSEIPLNLTYHCIRKDVFYDVFAYVPHGNLTEINYETDENKSVLLLYANKTGLIMADSDDCFITVSVELTDGVSLQQIADEFDFTVMGKPFDAQKAAEREQLSLNVAAENTENLNFLRRATFSEYVNDLLCSGNADREYIFYDLDGNDEQELLITYEGYISNVVAMENGKTNEGKSYRLRLCEDNVLVDEMELGGTTYYHIFRFRNNGDAVFSNSKEQSIVRLKCENGIWWRTSDTTHYADYDMQITEAEAKEILDSYKTIALETKPLDQFNE